MPDSLLGLLELSSPASPSVCDVISSRLSKDVRDAFKFPNSKFPLCRAKRGTGGEREKERRRAVGGQLAASAAETPQESNGYRAHKRSPLSSLKNTHSKQALCCADVRDDCLVICFCERADRSLSLPATARDGVA